MCGTSQCLISRSACSWDHPCVCGDYLIEQRTLAHRGGPPLRARDDTMACAITGTSFGPPPACAGTTSPIYRSARTPRDHPPRARDHMLNRLDQTPSPGSPRRCGDDSQIGQPTVSVIGSRTTPACAGATPPWTARRTRTWDQPRGCGDDSWVQDAMVNSQGPPPRVRGRRWRPSSSRAGPPDHPRVCGDADVQNTDGKHGAEILGPPPRVRGRRGARRVPLDDHRTTPACAGTARRRAAR